MGTELEAHTDRKTDRQTDEGEKEAVQAGRMGGGGGIHMDGRKTSFKGLPCSDNYFNSWNFMLYSDVTL